MRRALVLVALSAAALLGTGPASAAATASPLARARAPVEREVRLAEMTIEGFDVDFAVEDNDGRVTAAVTVSRGPQVARYSVPAKVTADRVTARFGHFGEIDYRIVPPAEASPECFGTGGESPATFEGTFTFSGERGYVHIDVDKAEGTYSAYPPPPGCPAPLRGRRVVPYSPSYSGSGATLTVGGGSASKNRAKEITVLDGAAQSLHGHHRIAIFGYLGELREGVSIAHGVQLVASSSCFTWNLAAGTATLRPPAPFTGSAHFARRAHGRPTWTGSLRMPVFGGDPVSLAGGSFRAALHKGTPQDE
jgi:hypothetical protein